MKNTHGPWYFNRAENCIAVSETNGDVRIAYMDDTSVEDEAKAYLIVKAPEFRAALEKIARANEYDVSRGPVTVREMKRIAQEALDGLLALELGIDE